MAWIGLALGLLGWWLLILAMPRHREALAVAPAAATPRRCRAGGWVALAASLAAMLLAHGLEQGAVYWLAMLMLAGLGSVLVLAALPTATRR